MVLENSPMTLHVVKFVVLTSRQVGQATTINCETTTTKKEPMKTLRTVNDRYKSALHYGIYFLAKKSPV